MFDLGVISVKNHQHVNLSDHYSGRLSDYGSYDTTTSENYANFRTWSGRLVSEGNMAKDGDDESGFCSPPLWRTSPTASPPHRKSNHYRSLSPASKAQAIARGQRELMEMVSRMPESCYELSLRDLVEQQPVVELKQESFREEKEIKREKGVTRSEKRMEFMKRNESLSRNNKGLLLKMVFPIGFGTKKKKKKKKNDSMTNNNSSSKVSPKSPIPEGSEIKDVDKEWWKKRFSIQSETDQSSGDSSNSNNGSGKSSVSTNSSDSTNRSSSRHGSGGGCLSFFRIKKKKNVE